jgi:hypothetical protein
VACVSYVLQQTLVVPALPTIQRDLDTTTTWVTWVERQPAAGAPAPAPAAGTTTTGSA